MGDAGTGGARYGPVTFARAAKERNRRSGCDTEQPAYDTVEGDRAAPGAIVERNPCRTYGVRILHIRSHLPVGRLPVVDLITTY
jgi:hypothetical protein